MLDILLTVEVQEIPYKYKNLNVALKIIIVSGIISVYFQVYANLEIMRFNKWS